MTDKIPLVSVIIPMFNSAKFITQTLESLAYQTMKDFEVVVVDDCSTDNSVEVVESFSERFNGRLHVIKLPKNTGTPGLPRNVGIQFARGKYIAFLDSDDLYTKTALEELTTLAEQYQADVLNINNNFVLWNGEKKSINAAEMTDFVALTNPKNLNIEGQHSPKEPMIETENLALRIQYWINEKYRLSTCSAFCRRDFLIENQIHFAHMFTAEDHIFKFACICLAKPLLLVPNIVYIVRPRDNSIMRNLEYDPAIYFRKRVNTFIQQFNVFNKFMDGIKFFNEHTDYRYSINDWIFLNRVNVTLSFYATKSILELNPIVDKEFHSDNTAASTYLFNAVNLYRLHLIKLQKEDISLKKELQKYKLQLIELQQNNIALKKELQKYQTAK